MSLFNTGMVKLHAGGYSNFKIDCDALSDEDICSIALQLAYRLPHFCAVTGIPEGGRRLADAMAKFRDEDSNNHLIVDDVFTTGMSMEKAKRDWFLPIFHPVLFGAVIFARSETPDWITPLFRMNNV